MFMSFDPLYFLFLAPAMLLGFWAQMRVKTAYSQASLIPASSGYTGAQTARHLLDSQGLNHVAVEPVAGYLSDHYDPTSRTLRLSDGVYDSNSIAALGIAAHEAGHALQHAQNDPMLMARNAIVPLAGIGSNLGWIMITIGFALAMAHSRLGQPIALLGIAIFSMTVVFQLVNLPVEFDASRRARKALLQYGLVQQSEDALVGNVLGAAAWTYVAATLSSASQLLYFMVRLGMLNQSDRDRDRY